MWTVVKRPEEWIPKVLFIFKKGTVYTWIFYSLIGGRGSLGARNVSFGSGRRVAAVVAHHYLDSDGSTYAMVPVHLRRGNGAEETGICAFARDERASLNVYATFSFRAILVVKGSIFVLSCHERSLGKHDNSSGSWKQLCIYDMRSLFAHAYETLFGCR